VIVNIKDKPWCTLGPSCSPRAGLSTTENQSIHPSLSAQRNAKEKTSEQIHSVFVGHSRVLSEGIYNRRCIKVKNAKKVIFW
jgi:hypothetical protein